MESAAFERRCYTHGEGVSYRATGHGASGTLIINVGAGLPCVMSGVNGSE